MTTQFVSKATLLSEPKPMRLFKEGFRLSDHIQISGPAQQRVVEFVGMGDLGAAWATRQRYEVDAGRDNEPLLYQPIYQEVSDPNLPRNVTINTIGPAGVVFEEILEGGEIKFATVGSGTKSVTIRHHGVGLEYSEEMFVYNELWDIATIERQAGQAYNALMNHLHFYPILNHSYVSRQQTAASSVGSTLQEKYLTTLENAITHSKADRTYPRRGPYALLVASGNYFTVQKALQAVSQQGISLQAAEVFRQIRTVIEYDGWEGSRGKKSTTYAGVTAGKGYLINLNFGDMDFKSYEKHGLRSESGDKDVSRLIMEQTVWHFRRGVYANPLAAVEEITWPTS